MKNENLEKFKKYYQHERYRKSGLNAFNGLIGQKIIKTEKEEKKIKFYLDIKQSILFQCYGDCCSSSWIEHMDEIPENSIVTDVIEKEVEVIEGDDCIQKYFYEIVTDKGSFTIEMRNSRNGYYGGWIEFKEISNID